MPAKTRAIQLANALDSRSNVTGEGEGRTWAGASRWARWVRQGQAPSRGFHTVLTVEGDREAGLKELSA